MKIAAFDLSLTATGTAVLDTGQETGPTGGLIKPRGRGVPRLQDAMDQVVAAAAGADVVVLEGYAYASGNRAHQMGELGGVVRLALHQRGFLFVDVPPSCLKKVATGKGNAAKEAVLVEAVKRLGYQGADHNVADARWLLAMAMVHYGLPGAPELPQAHLAGMAKVAWPELEAGAA